MTPILIRVYYNFFCCGWFSIGSVHIWRHFIFVVILYLFSPFWILNKNIDVSFCLPPPKRKVQSLLIGQLPQACFNRLTSAVFFAAMPLLGANLKALYFTFYNMWPLRVNTFTIVSVDLRQHGAKKSLHTKILGSTLSESCACTQFLWSKHFFSISNFLLGTGPTAILQKNSLDMKELKYLVCLS